MKRYVLTAACGLVLLLGGCGGRKPQAETAPASAAPHAVAPLVDETVAHRGTVDEWVVSSGRVRALDRALISAKITGRVDRVAVREGDRVLEGQPIVWLDDRDQRALVAQAEAAVQAARAHVSQLENGTGMTRTQVDVGVNQAQQSVLQAHTNTAKARAEYEDAQTDLARKDKLVHQGAIPQTLLDAARLRFRQAREGLRGAQSVEAAAQQSVRLAQSNTTQTRVQADEVAAARAALVQAEATLQAAQVALSETVINSPINGVVIARNVDPGQTVSPQQSGTLLQIVDNRHLELLVPVDERYAADLRRDPKVEIESDVAPDLRAEGRIKELIPSSDAASHTVQARVRVVDGADRLLDGMYAKARVRVDRHTGVVVPLTALQIKEDGATASVVTGTTVHKRPVRVLYHDETRAVVSGVSDGETLVASGTEGLVDGQEVRVAETGPRDRRPQSEH